MCIRDRRVNRAVTDGDSICSHAGFTERLDYEAELAVVIGKDADNVSAVSYTHLDVYKRQGTAGARILRPGLGRYDLLGRAEGCASARGAESRCAARSGGQRV